MRIAILDDNENVALKMADWSVLATLGIADHYLRHSPDIARKFGKHLVSV